MALVQYSPSRVIGVTLGLSAAGIAFGAVAGAAALGAVLVLEQGLPLAADPRVFLFAGALGAALGAMCAPLAGWLLLRRVPLGRAFAGLTLGTILGGVAGWFAPVTFNEITQPIAAAALGFLGAALVLRFKAARPSRRPGELVAPPN